MTELREMQQLLVDVWRTRKPLFDYHVGDLAWWSREPERRTRVWRDSARVVAWGWISPPADLDLAVDPAHAPLVDDVLAWFEEETKGVRTVWALETDAARIAALDRGGYRRADGPFMVHLAREIGDVEMPPLPNGYAFAEVEVEKRVSVQRSAFVSTLTGEKYRRVTSTWPYRRELDVVVSAPDASFASFCLAWLDEVNAVGELEPVGTHPDHRRRALASAASLEALRRLRAAGADTAIVYARGDADYPAPLRLYRGLGFEPLAARHRYVK